MKEKLMRVMRTVLHLLLAALAVGAAVADEPATGAGWARATEGQLRAAETRLAKLNADPTSELGQMAVEIRRVESLYSELD